MDKATQSESVTMSREEMQSALFANMVLQQTNMAMMFLGKIPHPETKERVTDLEMAQMFIDQLEMLEAKTKGNLDKQEQSLLKQSLMGVRMAFVEAVNEGGGTAAEKKTETKAAEPKSGAAPSVEPSASAESDESRKKFSKKY